MKIKLLKPHRHAGVVYAANDTLDVTVDTANYLAELRVATPLESAKVDSKSDNKSEVKSDQNHPRNNMRGKVAHERVADTVVTEDVNTNISSDIASVDTDQPMGNTPEI